MLGQWKEFGGAMTIRWPSMHKAFYDIGHTGLRYVADQRWERDYGICSARATIRTTRKVELKETN